MFNFIIWIKFCYAKSVLLNFNGFKQNEFIKIIYIIFLQYWRLPVHPHLWVKLKVLLLYHYFFEIKIK